MQEESAKKIRIDELQLLKTIKYFQLCASARVKSLLAPRLHFTRHIDCILVHPTNSRHFLKFSWLLIHLLPGAFEHVPAGHTLQLEAPE
jgi:hypothetical protein